MQGLLIRLIVIKKVLVASLLLVLSVAAAVGSQDMAGLEVLADMCGLNRIVGCWKAWPAGRWRWGPMP